MIDQLLTDALFFTGFPHNNCHINDLPLNKEILNTYMIAHLVERVRVTTGTSSCAAISIVVLLGFLLCTK
jgi:hypothetical protein